MKKGQVTIFVIIGAVILLAAGLFFFLSETLQEGQPGMDIIDVSLETRPTFEVVTQCLSKVSLDGLKKISNQGGWIDFPGMKYSELPYESDLVDFAPNKIAYWRHLYECGDAYCEESNMPPLCKPGSADNCFSNARGDNSIQEQLENYVNNNIEDCLDNFNSLSERYDIKIKDDPETIFIFAPSGTRVVLNYPLEVKSLKNQNTKMIEDYQVQFDIKYVEMYDLATSIYNFEKTTNFYEAQTMNLITIYSGIEEKLPPMSEIKFFDLGFEMWTQIEVNEILQYDLLPFMGTIRYMNAKNYYPIVEDDLEEYTKYSQGMYMGMNPKLGNDSKLYDLNVMTNYLYSPVYSKVGNGKQIIRPTNLGPDSNPILRMAGLFLKDYRFRYDIRYPLILTINDDKALNGEGFNFNFAMEVNIRNNVPAYNNFTNLNLNTPFQTSLADFDVRLPQNITIYSKNKHTNEPLSEVHVSYICGREFEIGLTKINQNNQAEFITQLPYCEMGGYLKFTKNGYAGTTIEYDNKLDGTNKVFTTELWPLQEKEVILLKRTMEDIEYLGGLGGNVILSYTMATHNLTDNETALVSVSNIKEKPYDEDIPMIGFLKYQHPGTELTSTGISSSVDSNMVEQAYQEGTIDGETRDSLLEQLNSLDSESTTEFAKEKYTLSLSPGTYNLDVSLFDYSGINIPEDEVDPCPSGIAGLFCDEDPIILPEQDFAMWMDGGVKLQIELDESVIYSNKTLTFYILEMESPSSWDDLKNIQEIDEYQVGKEDYIIPLFE